LPSYLGWASEGLGVRMMKPLDRNNIRLYGTARRMNLRAGDTPYPYPGANVLTPAGCSSQPHIFARSPSP